MLIPTIPKETKDSADKKERASYIGYNTGQELIKSGVLYIVDKGNDGAPIYRANKGKFRQLGIIAVAPPLPNMDIIKRMRKWTWRWVGYWERKEPWKADRNNDR